MPDGPSKSFRRVLVWQKAHAFALAVHRLTARFPAEELYGLTSQLRRAPRSVPANIVEGFRRRSIPDKQRFYNIAQGSADETLYHLIFAHDVGYADTQALQADLEEVCRLLQAYTSGLDRAES